MKTFIAALLVLAAIPAYAQNHAGKSKQITAPPEVTCKVKDLVIGAVTLQDQGTDYASVNIEIINNSDEPIVYLYLMSGDDKESHGLGIDGMGEPDTPIIVLPAHTLKTFQWHLVEIPEGFPIVVAGAHFLSGRTEGTKQAIYRINVTIERNRSDAAWRYQKPPGSDL